MRDDNGSVHAIGIDCDSKPKMIWDCCEPRTMTLNRNNLDICVGENVSFKSMKVIGILSKYY